MAKFTKPFAVKGLNVTSPKGKATWCKITEPDTKFNPKGELSTNLVCDPSEPQVKDFVAKLEALRDQAYNETLKTLGAKGKQYTKAPVYTDEYDEQGDTTGNIIFKFKLKDIDDRIANGKQSTIPVVDAKRQVVEPVPLIGNGSVIRCLAFANPYAMGSTKSVGISLMWSKMQLIELVEYSGGDGFEDEDGYSSEDEDDLDF